MSLNDSRDHPGVLVFPPLLFAFALALVIGLQIVLPLSVRWIAASDVAAMMLLLAGAALGVWGQRAMRRAGTNVNPRLPSTVVVSDGPFAYTRNPLYLALMLVLLGVSFALHSWWGVLVLIPLAEVLQLGVVRREERYLEAKFGEPYRRYCERVPRYLGLPRS